MEERELDALIEQSYGRIVRTSMVLCGNCADAEDLVQETFPQAINSRDKFAGRSLPDTWLYSILLNNHRKHKRSLAPRYKRILTWFRQHQLLDSSDVQGSLKTIEWRESLWSIAASLPKPQQQAIVLRDSEGLSYEDIATAIGCPIGTVRSSLHNGLKILKQRLEHSRDLSARLETERS